MGVEYVVKSFRASISQRKFRVAISDILWQDHPQITMGPLALAVQKSNRHLNSTSNGRVGSSSCSRLVEEGPGTIVDYVV